MRCLPAVLIAVGPALLCAEEPAPKPETKPPVPPRVGLNVPATVRLSVSSGPGRRTITVQEGDEKIELQERDNPKEITIRHERKVNGELKKDEYKAADLDALKKQHPAAADLYRRVTDRGGTRLIPGIGLPPFAMPNGQPLGPGHGYRSISATVKGQRVSIEDRYGAQIEISVTRTVDGKEQADRYSAADLATLRSEHPEIAALYSRLTGQN